MGTIRELHEIRNRKCRDCDLCKATDNVCIPGYGMVPAKIMLIGEAPGPREDSSGVPFQGKASKLLTAILSEAGISSNDVYRTHIVHCRTPENRPPDIKETRACRKYLLEEIRIVRPQVIITLGNSALKGLFDTNLVSISKERGRLLAFEDIKVIPTYHPAAAIRKSDFAKWIYQDIKEGLKRVAAGPKEALKLDYRLITPKNKQEALKAILSQKNIVVDVETTGLDMFDPKEELLVVGFCSKEGQSWVFHKDTKGMLEFTQQVLDEAELVIGHNLKFDLKWLFTRGITYKGPVWDTQIALHTLDENYPDKSLKHLARTDLGEMGHQLDEAEKVILQNRKEGAENTPEEWRVYNGGDVDATFRLYKKYSAALQREPVLKDLMTLDMKVLKVLTYMEIHGFQIDLKAHARLKKAYEEKIKIKEGEVKQVFGDINLGSPKQVAKRLYVDFGFPIIKTTKGGDASVDQDTLEELSHMGRSKQQKEAIGKLLEYRGMEKIYSVYILGLVKKGHIKPDGRLHCNFKIPGTVTGRMSCSDPNLQNIKRNEDEDMHDDNLNLNVKNMFVSVHKNGVIIQGDYSQAELRILAHMADDKALIAAFESGRDIHQEVATKVFHKKYEDITSAERKYTKQVNFGIVYLIGPAGLSSKLHDSERVAKKLIDDWFIQFPSVKKWIGRMKNKVVTQGYTESVFGRRRRFFHVNPETGEGREAQRQGVNAPIQGGAGDLTKWVMMKTHHALKKAGLKARVICNVHDAVMIDSPREEVMEAARILQTIAMNPPMKLGVPLKMDLKIGPSWGQLKSIELKQEK